MTPNDVFAAVKERLLPPWNSDRHTVIHVGFDFDADLWSVLLSWQVLSREGVAGTGRTLDEAWAIFEHGAIRQKYLAAPQPAETGEER